jgi:hypothetical protein
VSVPSSTGGEVWVKNGWFCLYLYRKRISWDGSPGQSEVGGRLGVMGVKEVGVRECVSVYGSLETLNCCFFPLRRCISGFFTHTCWRWNRHSVPKRRLLILKTPGKYPEDNSSLLQHGESLTSTPSKSFFDLVFAPISGGSEKLAQSARMNESSPPPHQLQYSTHSVD